MIKLTQRRVFDFEKEERLRGLLPRLDPSGRAAHYAFWYLVLPALGGGLIARLLRVLLPLSEGEAVAAGLALALAASVYASVEVKRRSRAALREERARLDAAVIETIDIEVERAWSLEHCACCTRPFLLKVGEKEYVFLETSDVEQPWQEEFPTRRMKIERERGAKTLWDVRPEGPPICAEELPVGSDELLDAGVAECEILSYDELPAPLKAAVAGA